jgi:hypothetical protein
LQSLPYKRQDRDEYFSGTKQMKDKGRHKSRYETVISLEDLQRPLLETAAKQTYVQSQGKPLHRPRWQERSEYVYRNNERCCRSFSLIKKQTLWLLVRKRIIMTD